MIIFAFWPRTDGPTHTAIIMYTCGSCNTVSTLNRCYKDTAVWFGESILVIEQSISVRAVSGLIVGEAETVVGEAGHSKCKNYTI